jgi:hypothetical protein
VRLPGLPTGLNVPQCARRSGLHSGPDLSDLANARNWRICTEMKLRDCIEQTASSRLLCIALLRPTPCMAISLIVDLACTSGLRSGQRGCSLVSCLCLATRVSAWACATPDIPRTLRRGWRYICMRPAETGQVYTSRLACACPSCLHKPLGISQ